MTTTARMSWCRVPLLMLAVGGALGGSRASADAMYSISAIGDPLANSADPPTLYDYSAPNTPPEVSTTASGGFSEGGYSAWTGDVKLPGGEGGYPLAMASGPGIPTFDIPIPPIQPDSYVLGLSASGLALVGNGIGWPATQIYNINAYLGAGASTPDWPRPQSSLPNANIEIYGLNGAGQFVGYFTTSTTDPSKSYPAFEDGAYLEHAFLATPTGPIIDLNDLIPANSGWTLLRATGINDDGQIVGYGINPSGTLQAYELSPSTVPEPSTLAMFAVVACACGYHAVARQNVRGA